MISYTNTKGKIFLFTHFDIHSFRNPDDQQYPASVIWPCESEDLKLELTFYLYLVIFPDLMENKACQVHERARVTLATVSN